MKLLWTFAALLVVTLTEKARFDNYRVHRLIPRTKKHLHVLKRLEEDHRFNFWTPAIALNQPVDIMVPPHQRPEFRELVHRIEIQERVLVENVQELVDEERGTVSGRSKEMDWTNYHTLEEFDAWMDDLERKYKNVKKIVVGKTYENRSIKGLEITFGANLTTVFIESTIHAKEWITAASTSWVVNQIISCSMDPIWKKFNYIYIPFFNPDGYAYTWTTDRLWRKTRKPNEGNLLTCYGVDPNRNWDYQWEGPGSSKDSCSETYRGPKPFSEIETKTISTYLKNTVRVKNIDIFLAFHSYAQLLMYPWGYTNNPTALTKTWKRIGNAAAKDLAAVNRTDFVVGNIYGTIYPASGNSLDWYYGTFNSTIAYTYELRDKGKYGFILPPKYIIPSAAEVYASVKRILTEYEKLPPKSNNKTMRVQ